MSLIRAVRVCVRERVSLLGERERESACVCGRWKVEEEKKVVVYAEWFGEGEET